MTKRVKKHMPTLQLLSNCDKHTTRSVLKSAKPELIGCISDICHNVLQGRVKLLPKDKKRLAKYKTNIRAIAKKSTTQKSKRELIQKGGFLTSLLAPLIGSLIPVITTAIKKKRK